VFPVNEAKVATGGERIVTLISYMQPVVVLDDHLNLTVPFAVLTNCALGEFGLTMVTIVLLGVDHDPAESVTFMAIMELMQPKKGCNSCPTILA
jgi:hypothetical protein